MSDIVLGPFAGLPSNPNITNRRHWAKNYKENQTWKELVGMTALAQRATHKDIPYERATVSIHIILGNKQNRDWDNLVASFKGVLDGLKGIVIVDDGLKYIGIPQFTMEWSLKPQEHQFTIRISNSI